MCAFVRACVCGVLELVGNINDVKGLGLLFASTPSPRDFAIYEKVDEVGAKGEGVEEVGNETGVESVKEEHGTPFRSI